jgi:2-C-methyl-D-erythritol 4-phosphate cytidylyltransferase
MSHAAPGRVAAIIPAAGSGTRLGASVPKAFVELNGLTLLTRSAHAMSSQADVIAVSVPEDYIETARQLLSEVDAEVHIVIGGADRQSSVARALAVVPEDVAIVLVHDAARPLVPSKVVSAVVSAVRSGAQAVIPVLPVADTLKRVDLRGSVVETVDRTTLRRVQTPQAFARVLLDRAYADPTHSATDDAGLVESMGVTVETVSGDERAMKITTEHDLEIATLLERNAQ